jgi:hypothetical protein
MDVRRRNFYLALVLYVGWIVCLGFMAFTSGDPPRPRPSQPAGR